MAGLDDELAGYFAKRSQEEDEEQSKLKVQEANRQKNKELAESFFSNEVAGAVELLNASFGKHGREISLTGPTYRDNSDLHPDLAEMIGSIVVRHEERPEMQYKIWIAISKAGDIPKPQVTISRKKGDASNPQNKYSLDGYLTAESIAQDFTRAFLGK